MAPSPDTFPPEHDHRTLILCFDGTDNKISTMHSNVARFFSLLKKDQPTHQLVYYQTGIGTYTSSNITDPISSKVAKTIDSMFAQEITSHVKDGYTFIMQHYLDGDKICIFGFSRGAYTARALAGMIHKVGLLPQGNIRHLKYAYKVFKQTNEKGWKQAAEFKRCFSIAVEIEFVGIWDSVGSIGLNNPGLPFSNASTTIKTFRHALALDERRALFQANAWHCYEHVLSSDPGTAKKDQDSDPIRNYLQWEREYAGVPDHKFRTDVLEVWFAGCHSDIGGGAVPNDTPYSLARISLRWMVRQCFSSGTGILFTAQALREIGLEPGRLYPQVLPRRILSDNEPAVTDGENTVNAPEHEERQDALSDDSDLHDKLNSVPLWWICEVLPFRRWNQVEESGEESKSIKSFSWNLGRPRRITHQGSSRTVSVHYTVKTRMEGDLGYLPKARFLDDSTHWVE